VKNRVNNFPDFGREIQMVVFSGEVNPTEGGRPIEHSPGWWKYGEQWDPSKNYGEGSPVIEWKKQDNSIYTKVRPYDWGDALSDKKRYLTQQKGYMSPLTDFFMEMLLTCK
jgi:hypothetical protein